MFARLRTPTHAHRALTLLWATLFVLGGAARGVACPAGHGAAHAEHGAHHEAPAAPAEQHGCTCVGDCFGGAAPVLPEPAVRVAFGGAVRAADAPAPPRAEHLPGRRAYEIPFPTAPPRTG
jgi:hypothetical protein